MYVCGPTVYNYIHIGNARTFLSFDVLRRYLRWRGLAVRFVQNITDVDDKIINAAAEEGTSTEAVARKYEEAFWQQMGALGVEPPDAAPRATEEIDGMIELVKTLLDKGHAYVIDGDVFFDVRSWEAYGSLSGRSLEEMRAGERIEVDPRKRDPMDFALWKSAKPGEPSWDSPWGPGRPGWHLECSEMSRKYLGGVPFDIHGGASDLVFPHHENEKAQAEAAWGAFARYWLHGGLLNIDTEKMSKSAGNFTLLKDVLAELRDRGHDERAAANVVRMLMLKTHYRSPLEFSPERLDEAAAAVERLETAVRNLDWLLAMQEADTGSAQAAGSDEARAGAEAVGATKAEKTAEAVSAAEALAAQTTSAEGRFVEAMDDDFNTAGALGELFELARAGNALVAAVGEAGASTAARAAAEAASRCLVDLAAVLGLRLAAQPERYPADIVALAAELAAYSGDDPAEAAQALLERRAEARRARDWARSDAIRERLGGLGLLVQDTPQGQRLVVRR